MGTKKETTKKSETAKAAPKSAAKKTKAVAAKAENPAVVKAKPVQPVQIVPKATQKSPSKPAGKPAATKKASSAASKPVSPISRDDIALRAYYIAEKRQKLGIHGDSTQDWINAERELVAEAKAKK